MIKVSAGSVPSGLRGKIVPGLSPWLVDGRLLPVTSHDLLVLSES